MKRKRKQSVLVGCCGFGGAMTSYADLFDVIEIQHTFYQPPKLETLKKWRQQFPPNFEFTLKAWQLITHTSSSPTYRRLKRELTEKEADDAGAFRNSKIVKEAWQTTMDCADALNAKRILFQCPNSFKPTESNLKNLRKFFSKIERNGKTLYWEPRGSAWTPDLVKALCEELSILHAVDPFVSQSQTPQDLYFRLHGKNSWRYKYSEDDLVTLNQMVGKNANSSYVFFNNVTMREDAARFLSHCCKT